MAKITNHKDQKGFCGCSTKWNNMGKKKSMLMEGSKMFKTNEKRTKLKAK